MDPDKTLIVEITALAYGGDAIGRLPDGRAVFVPFGLPGEKVRVRIINEKRGHARAELVTIIEPSLGRIKPRCPHFGICGGCHYQHMPYQDQLEAKKAILEEQLERIGGILSPPVEACVPSPSEWNYRNHIQFHLTGEGKIGYLAPDSHTVIPIRECHMPESLLNSIWPNLDFEPVPGLEEIDIREGTDEEVIVLLVGKDPSPPEIELDLPLSVVYQGPERSYVVAGNDALFMRVLDRSFRVSAGAFFQVNTRQAEAMVRFLLENLPLQPESVLLDLYCGVGLFSAFMAERVGKLLGVEVSPVACDDFAANLDSFDNVELYQGSVESVLPSLTLTPDLVILDPPRAGVDRIALQAILEKHPDWIAYVSCDPATLARDIRWMVQGGYQLERVTPFDLFPQTYHIESISLLRLPGM